MSTIGGSASAGHAEDLEQPLVPAGRAELRARRGRRVGVEARAQPLAQERVDRAQPQHAAVACVARRRSSCSSSQVSLPAEKYGSSGIPLRSRTSSASPSRSSRSSTSSERLSCQVTIGVSGWPLSPSQASTDSPWWSSPQAVISPGASSSSSATAPTTASSTACGSCSTQPGRGWLSGFSRRASRRGCRSRVEQDRLDGRRALVDADQQAHAASAARRSGATTRRRGAADRPAAAAVRARVARPGRRRSRRRARRSRATPSARSTGSRRR